MEAIDGGILKPSFPSVTDVFSAVHLQKRKKNLVVAVR